MTISSRPILSARGACVSACLGLLAFVCHATILSASDTLLKDAFSGTSLGSPGTEAVNGGFTGYLSNHNPHAHQAPVVDTSNQWVEFRAVHPADASGYATFMQSAVISDEAVHSASARVVWEIAGGSIPGSQSGADIFVGLAPGNGDYNAVLSQQGALRIGVTIGNQGRLVMQAPKVQGGVVTVPLDPNLLRLDQIWNGAWNRTKPLTIEAHLNSEGYTLTYRTPAQPEPLEFQVSGLWSPDVDFDAISNSEGKSHVWALMGSRTLDGAVNELFISEVRVGLEDDARGTMILISSLGAGRM